jgi:hypothetical protein
MGRETIAFQKHVFVFSARPRRSRLWSTTASSLRNGRVMWPYSSRNLNLMLPLKQHGGDCARRTCTVSQILSLDRMTSLNRCPNVGCGPCAKSISTRGLRQVDDDAPSYSHNCSLLPKDAQFPERMKRPLRWKNKAMAKIRQARALSAGNKFHLE